jgi:hypothetical protein
MPKNLTEQELIKTWRKAELKKYINYTIVTANSFYENYNGMCTKCEKHYDASHFKVYRTIDNKRKKLYYGRKTYCNSCQNLYTRKWRYNDPDKVIELLREDKCQICNDPFKSDRNKFIDHCHKTNIIRGVLCTKCNTLLGMIERKKQIFTNIKKYLK